jgi:predicted DNA-binding transcriptional regulator YafY
MKTRKNLPKPALERIYAIDREIASGRCPNTTKLARAFECGTSTISRDIEFMRDRLHAPIEYNARRRGYYYAEKTFRLSAGFATTGDMLALGMAKSLLALYHGTPLYASARRLLEEIAAPFTADTNEGRGGQAAPWFERRILVPPVASAPVAREIWDLVTAALKENLIISFDYQGIYNAAPRPRRVHPYQLLFDTGAWYLSAFCEERKAVRLFSLARMKRPAATSSHFKLPPDYDYAAQNDGSYFGVFIGRKERYRIAFDAVGAAWARERVWAADQKFEEVPGGVIMDFTSTQYNKVLDWVLARGACAAPLEPELLVKEWREHIEKLYRKITDIHNDKTAPAAY